MCRLPIYSFYTEVFCSFVPLIYGFFSCTQNSAYAYHLHFCWRTAYQGSAYRIPSKMAGIRRTEKGGYSLSIGMTHDFDVLPRSCMHKINKEVLQYHSFVDFQHFKEQPVLYTAKPAKACSYLCDVTVAPPASNNLL